MPLVTDQATLRISSRDFVRDDGSGGKLLYRGDLGRGQSFRFMRRLQFWPWGRSASSAASGELRIDNGDGSYDTLVTIDSRNFKASFRRVANGVEQPIVTPLLDGVEAPNDREILFRLIDPLALFDVPLQLETFDASADPAVQGQPLPIMIGACRSVPAVLWDANHQGGAYRLSYMPVNGIAAVYDSAVALDPATPQWEFDTRIGSAGFFLNQATVGKVVADASATGDGSIPAQPVELLSGRGDFSVAFAGADSPPAIGTSPGKTGGMPPGWELTGTIVFGGDPADHNFTHDAASGSARMSLPFGTDDGSITFDMSTGKLLAVFTDSDAGTPFRFVAGKRYRWTLELARDIQGGTQSSSGGLLVSRDPAQLFLQVGAGDFSANEERRIRKWATFSPSAAAGVYSGTVTAPASWNGEPLSLLFVAKPGTAHVGEVTIVEVPDVGAISLPSITLQDYIREIVRLSGQPDSLIEYNDLAAIDATAASIGYFTDRQVQALSMIRAPLDSYTADAYTDRAGRVRFARLRDPAGEAATFTISPANLRRKPRIRIDRAEQLTTSATARRNWYVHSESELAGSILDLPLDQRKQWTQPARITVQADLPDGLPEQYRHALGANPLPTLYDDGAVALAEIQRVADLYTQIRFVADLEILIDTLDVLPDLDEIVLVQYPRWGFDAGRKMLLFLIDDGLEGEERRQVMRARLWG